MTFSRLDQVYRSILLSKYFVKGWGKPDDLKRLFKFRKVVSTRESCFKLVSPNYPVTITKDEELSDCRLLEGHFPSPFNQHLPGLLPEEAQLAHFQVIFPKKWSSEYYKPVCIQLAGTGDHYFWRRRTIVAKPLLEQSGIGSVILENPFYGTRKPKDQIRSMLHNVSDIFVMGGCLIMECLVLFHWLEKAGYGPLGVTGLSMGGHMASLAATAWPKPLALIPCLSWSTASGVFTEGVLSGAINWELLEYQYKSDKVFQAEIEKMVTIIEDDAFKAGQEFAKNYPKSMTHVHSTLISDNSDNNGMNCNNICGTASTRAASNSSTLDERKIGLDDYYSIKNNYCNDKTDLAISSLRNNHLTGIDNENKPPPNLTQISKFLNLSKNVIFKNIGGLFKIYTKTGNGNKAVKPLNAEDRKNLLNILDNRLGFSSKSHKRSSKDLNWREHEALHFMRGVMDECTHLRNFSIPVDTSLIIAVCARDDGYVPREGVTNLADIWPGAEVRYIEAGHITAFVLHQKVFRTAIIDAFERVKLKYHKHDYKEETSRRSA